jgi:hypothetical protein
MSWVGDVQRILRARKQHRCHWCGEAIEVGQSYARWFSKSDGPYTTRVHPECDKAWGQMVRLDDEYRYGVHEATHCRGCTCERGSCVCSKTEVRP